MPGKDAFMKRRMALLLGLSVLATALVACRAPAQTGSSTGPGGNRETQPERETASMPESPAAVMPPIEIAVGTTVFSARLYDNKAARTFFSKLPLTLDMQELNGNEKYHDLPDSLPTDARRPEGIRAGDLMLYGSDCLVLFYQSLSTSYRYTPLGYVEDAGGLADVLGDGDVRVVFRAM